MNQKSQLFCAHSGLLFAALMGLGIFGVAGWLPPIDPGRSADSIAQMFRTDTTRIRIGMSILAAASVLWWPLAAAISSQMKRIEGYRHHPLASVQLAAASGTVLAIIIPSYLWLVLTYRSDATSADLIQLVNDYCWFSFVGMYPPVVLQNIVIGSCILLDKSPQKVFPRWVAYVNFWFAIGFVPGALVPFFKGGPFAWNGLITFWMVAILFFAWIVVMWWATVRAIRQQAAIEGPA